MSEYSGLIIVFDEERRAWLLHEYQYFKKFSDTFSASDWNPKQYEIALLSFENKEINSICLAKRGRKVNIKVRP